MDGIPEVHPRPGASFAQVGPVGGLRDAQMLMRNKHHTEPLDKRNEVQGWGGSRANCSHICFEISPIASPPMLSAHPRSRPSNTEQNHLEAPCASPLGQVPPGTRELDGIGTFHHEKEKCKMSIKTCLPEES